MVKLPVRGSGRRWTGRHPRGDSTWGHFRRHPPDERTQYPRHRHRHHQQRQHQRRRHIADNIHAIATVTTSSVKIRTVVTSRTTSTPSPPARPPARPPVRPPGRWPAGPRGRSVCPLHAGSAAGEVLLSPHRLQRSPQRRSGPAADGAGGCPPPCRGSCAATWTPTHTKSHVDSVSL